MNFYFVPPLILQKLIWIPSRLVFSFFGRLKIEGLENLRSIKDPVIFACNHVSEADPFIVPTCLPFLSKFSPIFYATRERSFYQRNGWRKYLFGGWFINAWGGHTAQVGLKNYEKSLSKHINIINAGGNFCLFPEGGIGRTGKIENVKGGIAYLASRSNSQIVPVAISGASLMSMADFFGRRRKMTVRFGLPITQDELRAKVTRNRATPSVGDNIYKRQAEYVMKKVENLLGNKPVPVPKTYTQLLDKVSV